MPKQKKNERVRKLRQKTFYNIRLVYDTFANLYDQYSIEEGENAVKKRSFFRGIKGRFEHPHCRSDLCDMCEEGRKMDIKSKSQAFFFFDKNDFYFYLKNFI
jgi:hypothetical protein